MATTIHDDVDDGATLKLDTERALQSIGYNSILATENGTSSEDEMPESQSIPAEDARSAIGFSIGREQMRMTSPQTPAVEKAAAMEKAGGFWATLDGSVDTLVEEDEDMDEADESAHQSASEIDVKSDHTSSAEVSGSKFPPPAEIRTGTDSSASQTTDKETSVHSHRRPRSGLFDGIFNRFRSNSGTDTTAEPGQKSFLPKHFSISAPFTGFQQTKQTFDANIADGREDARQLQRVRSGSDGQMATFSRDVVLPASEIPEDMPRRVSVQTTRSSKGLLRRSTSDQSLTLRTPSRSETLGDDSRFEGVNSQVNSRFKAVKDSWQDANIKFSSLSNIKVPNFAPDFLRERASSVHKKQGTRSISAAPDSFGPAPPGKPIDPPFKGLPASGRELMYNAPSRKLLPHPHFHRAIEKLEGDLVILGGYRGSILRSAQPPHRQMWVPIKVGLNIRKVNLEAGFDEDSDERAAETVVPDGMLTHIGPVDISRRLFKRLRQCENSRNGKLTIRDYGYDWRLSPHHLSRQLVRYLENLPCNQPGVPKEKRGATVIAHSLGGLITRHAVNQRPELFKGVVYAGVPQTCVNILGPLRHGDEVLLSQRVLTAQVNFSIRTSYALLPLDGRCFIDIDTNEEYPVDFFDVNTWTDLRLSPCVNRALPPLQPAPKPTGITGYVASVASVLPSLPLRGRKDTGKMNEDPTAATAGGAIGATMATSDTNTDGVDSIPDDGDPSHSIRTAVTIPKEKAVEYLDRTLKAVKRFKEELDFNPKHSEANMYPPIAVIYGKTVPTVYGAKVRGKDGIKHLDAYDNLAFASGDGVVLARAAMAPEGYKPVRGGIVSSDRGHVTLLGDLEAVGKCLNAINRSRRKGVGSGKDE